MSWPDIWVAFDTETTGVGSDARILEVGAVRFELGEPVEEFGVLLNPPDVDWNDPKVQQALTVNNIDPCQLMDKPTFGAVYETLAKFMDTPVWVAHNVQFDLRMLLQECNRIGHFDLMRRAEAALCTMSLSYLTEPGLPDHKLQTVASRWRIRSPGAHRAVADARTCGRVLSHMFCACRVPCDWTEMVQMNHAAQHAWRSKGRR